MSHLATKSRRRMAIAGWLLFSLVILVPSAFAAAHYNHPGDSESLRSSNAKLYFEVQLEGRPKLSASRPGDVIEGKLLRDVYFGDHKIFPAESRVRLTVSGLERRRREPNDHWPWVVRVFTPHFQNYPLFQSGSVILPDKANVPICVSLVSMDQKIEIRADSRGKSDGAETGRRAVKGTVLTLEAENPGPPELAEMRSLSTPFVRAYPRRPVTLTRGTRAHVILLEDLRASKNRAGDLFQALLVEPVRQGTGIVLPEGTIFEGKVLKSTPPRWLSRPASIRIEFTRIDLPGGKSGAIIASLTQAEVDKQAHLKMNSEGVLSGGNLGKAWLLINFGMAAGVAKESDDAIQLIVEAIVSTATDASTAGVARMVAAGASGVFMITRHGRDVALPKYSAMDIVLDRSLTLPALSDLPAVRSDSQEERRGEQYGQ